MKGQYTPQPCSTCSEPVLPYSQTGVPIMCDPLTGTVYHWGECWEAEKRRRGYGWRALPGSGVAGLRQLELIFEQQEARSA